METTTSSTQVRFLVNTSVDRVSSDPGNRTDEALLLKPRQGRSRADISNEKRCLPL